MALSHAVPVVWKVYSNSVTDGDLELHNEVSHAGVTRLRDWPSGTLGSKAVVYFPDGAPHTCHTFAREIKCVPSGTTEKGHLDIFS